MINKESNSDFFSYNGTISRKDYTINLLIVVALYLILSFTKFENLLQYTKPELLVHIFVFLVSLFKFLLVMSTISIIFRRVVDITLNKSETFQTNSKKIFAILYVFPILHLFCLRYFLDIIPSLVSILDLITLYILMPISVITSIILCFIKGK